MFQELLSKVKENLADAPNQYVAIAPVIKNLTIEECEAAILDSGLRVSARHLRIIEFAKNPESQPDKTFPTTVENLREIVEGFLNSALIKEQRKR